MARRPRPVTARLVALRERFDRWRGSVTKKSRIPAVLWDEAVAAAEECGLHPTARVLRLNSDTLKKRVAQKSGKESAARAPQERPRQSFIELDVGARHCGEFVLELQARGEKLRLEVKGAAVPDLASLVAAFGSRRR